MGTVDFPSQLPFIERLNDTEIPVLIAYAGRDPLLEVPVLEEFVDAFRDAKRLVRVHLVYHISAAIRVDS
jgi:hypothetical protein